MKLLFETRNGDQLYGVVEKDGIVSLHSTNPPAIIAALREDEAGEDLVAKTLAKEVLKCIELVGIDVIE